MTRVQTASGLVRVGVFAAALTLLTGVAAAAAPMDAQTATMAAVGPPGGLPAPVPDFVATNLELVTEFLGSVADGNPGGEIADVAGSGPGGDR